MARSPAPAGPATYEIRVDGHLDDHWSGWFGDLTLTHESDGTTSLRALVPDQAGLHGLLRKVRDLGVTLISVAVVDHPDGSDHGAADGQRSDAAPGSRFDERVDR
jgi:hypothetical protein